MQLHNFIEDISDKVTDHVNENFEKVSAESLGLDRRAAYDGVFVSDEAICIHTNGRRNLDYYGGFEYVDGENTKVVGDWVFYLVECERVRGHLARKFDHLEIEEDREAE